MAEDLHKEGPEEENNHNKGSNDDDDFGLPDLEFEELDELDLDLEEDEPSDDSEDNFILEEEKPQPEAASDDQSDTSALDEGIDEVEDVLDSAQLISDRLGDDSSEKDFSSDINYDELLGDRAKSKDADAAEEDMSELDKISIDTEDDFSDSKDDSLSDISSPDELAALGIADEEEVTPEPAESPKDSLFGSDDDNEDSAVFGSESDFEGGSIFASDDISLKQEEEKNEFQSADEATLPPTYKPYADDDSKSGFAKVIIFGAIGFALVGFIFYYFFTQDIGTEKAHNAAAHKEASAQKTTKPKSTAKATTSKNTDGAKATTSSSAGDAAKKAESSAKSTGSKAPEAKKPAKAATVPAGEIVEIQQKTGRSYIIIGSFVDQDLANDYAKELTAAGSGVKVIFPYGKSKRYRVSIADFDTYGDAQSQMETYKATYGPDIWALKY